MDFRRLLPIVFSALLLTAAPVSADDPADGALPGETGGRDDRALPPAPASPPHLARVAPVELKIPRLGVDADVEPVGADPDGAMSAPSDPDAVAWWSLGWGTGEPGNVVLAGHVDWGGRLRVFGALRLLEAGDQVVVVDERAREYFYQVVWSRQVEAEGADVDSIFGPDNPPELTLITCGGSFDQSQRMYLDRIVVRARLV